MKWTPWIKVVETDSVPKTRISVGMFLPLEGGGKEPIGERIIEVPEDTDATEVLRNPRSGFIAYVPLGSIKKGEALVTTGESKTVRCGSLSWNRFEWPWARSRYRGPFAQLSCAADV